MIREVRGNILHADVEAIVNPVNTKGVMSLGLAAQFKEAYPAMFLEYRASCRRGEIKVGIVHPWATLFTHPKQPRWIISFPTKQHWKDPSQIEWIDDGLSSLRATITRLRITSIAVPALGCGLGGLPWPEVRALIEAKLGDLPDVEVWLYPPFGPERS